MMGSMGILANGLDANARALDIYANNIANTSSLGFQSSFPEFVNGPATKQGGFGMAKGVQVAGSGTQIASVRSTRPGPLQAGGPFDLALLGPGYLPLRQNNRVVYSRGGAMRPDAKGYLVNAAGAQVLDAHLRAVRLPTGTTAIKLGPHGSLYALSAGGKSTTVTRLQALQFANSQGLVSIGSGMLQPSANAGTPVPATNTLVRAGYVEQSNESLANDLVGVITSAQSAGALGTLLGYESQMAGFVNQWI